MSARPDPTEKDENDKPALWLLPKTGEPRRLATRPGGVSGVRTGGSSIVYLSDVFPGDLDTEQERRKEREEAGITAILHEGYPVRFWDHDLGPARPRLFSARTRRPGPRRGRRPAADLLRRHPRRRDRRGAVARGLSPTATTAAAWSR